MAGERLHVLFFVPSLGGGGAERHLVRVANHLDRARFRVSVAVCRGGGAFEGELAPDVAYRVLGARRILAAVRPLAALLREARPDLVCSFLDPANVVAVAAARLARWRAPLVLGVQNTVSLMLGPGNGFRHRALGRALPLVYRAADAVVALTAGVRLDLARVAPRLAGRIHEIANAGYDDAALAAAREPLPPGLPLPRPLLVACGRLTAQKDYPTLLQAFQGVRARFPAAGLWVLGEGELRAELQAEAARLGVGGAVWFAGFQANPYPFMAAADLFVLSSRWEGFGNVIVEAMALGTPVVATDCPHGPGEILQGGASGLLVPPADPAALAAALLRVLEDGALRARLAQAARERARSFSPARIAGEYGALFLALAGRDGAGPRAAAPRRGRVAGVAR